MRKRFLSVLLCLLMVISTFAVAIPVSATETTGKKITEYSVGDEVEYGWYPQSEVTDNTIKGILTFNAGATGSWTSYGYYNGTSGINETNRDGKMIPTDYMVYTDIVYDNNKYRGVYFTKYRPRATYRTANETVENSLSYQIQNEYFVNTIYWFKFEPIQWRVLDPATGLVMSKTILDSQAYNNYLLKEDVADPYSASTWWGNSEKTYYSNNYEKSSIRAWLNDDFYNTAFGTVKQNSVAITTLDNSAVTSDRAAYNVNSTNDKVFLLAYSDVMNTNYGFQGDLKKSASRVTTASEYAKSQGLGWQSTTSTVLLRTAGRSAGANSAYNGYTGVVTVGGGVSDYTYYGVRPAMSFNLTDEIEQIPVIANTCKIGTTEYKTVSEALDATPVNETAENPTVITLLSNVKDKITVDKDRYITLDLNGYVLSTSQSQPEKDYIYDAVPLVNCGVLKIVDSDKTATEHNVYYFTDEKCSHGIRIDNVCEDCESGIAEADGRYDTYSTETPNDMTGVITVTGGAIAGNFAKCTLVNQCNLTIDGGSIIGGSKGVWCVKSHLYGTLESVCIINDCFISGYEYYGLDFSNKDVTVTMNGGIIDGNNFHSTVGVMNNGTFIMNDGIIRNNGDRTGTCCDFAAGVNNYGTFIMTGGTITKNSSLYFGGVFNTEEMTVGGTAKIYDNVGGVADNIAIIKMEDEGVEIICPITIGDSTDGTDGNKVLKPAEGMNVGVAIVLLAGIDYENETYIFEQSTGAFTTNATAADAKYFFPDSNEYGIKYVAASGEGEDEIPAHFELTESKACKIGTTEYKTVSEALAATPVNETAETPTVITLIANSKDTFIIPADRYITLDLNGFVLESAATHVGEHSFANNGVLTVMDSDKTADEHKVYYFTDAKCPSNVAVGETCAKCGGTAKKDGMYDTYTTVQPDDMTGVITVTGGAIIAFGVDVLQNCGSLTINGGSIIGGEDGLNCTNRSICTINDCFISGYRYSGLYIPKGTVIMNGGIIDGNNSDRTSGVSVSGTFIMNDGIIRNNGNETVNENEYAGGVINNGEFIMTGGTITGNCCSLAGGVCNIREMTIGGTAKIYDNVGGVADNVALIKIEDEDNEMIFRMNIGDSTDGTDGNKVLKPADGMNVGVSVVAVDTYTENFIKSTGAFTTNGTAADAKYFFSDSDDFGVKFVAASGEGENEIPAHLALQNLYNITNATKETDKATANGYITVSETAFADDTVTVTVVPNTGYQLSSLDYNDGTADTAIVKNAENAYTFTMPAKDVTVKATFALKTIVWSYAFETGKTNVVIATGKRDGVTVSTKTYTLSAAGGTYNNTAYGATLTCSVTEENTIAIEYYNGETKLDSAPINAGSYTAKAVIGDKTATVNYTIGKANATVGNLTVNTKTCVSVTLSAPTVTTITDNTVYYAYNTQNTAPATGWQTDTAFTGLQAGTEYFFFVKVTADNYNDYVSSGLSVRTAAHTWNAGEVTTAANCKAKGVKTFTCTVCPATKTEDIEKDAANHVGGTETRDIVSETCGKAGYTGDTYCLGCGVKTATGTTIPATGNHTWSNWNAENGTRICTADGCGAVDTCPHTDTAEGETCAICGTVVTLGVKLTLCQQLKLFFMGVLKSFLIIFIPTMDLC